MTKQRAKLIVAVIALGAAVAVFAFRGGGPEFPDEVNFICVATGKTYDIDTDDVKAFPWINPETGERTLVPCQRQGEQFVVDAHYRPLLTGRLKDVNKWVDPSTLLVRTSPE